MKRFFVAAMLSCVCLVAFVGTASAAPFETNQQCLSCHDLATGTGAFTRVDFDVPGIPGPVDLTRCRVCHLNLPDLVSYAGSIIPVHLHYGQRTCASCHADMSDVPLAGETSIVGDLVRTSFGYFKGTQSLNATSGALHRLHRGGGWVDATLSASGCSRCHGTASCNACHTAPVPHTSHAVPRYPAPTVRQANGLTVVTAAVTCVNSSCHSLATAGTTRFNDPSCASCHADKTQVHGYDNVDHVADDGLTGGVACSSCHALDVAIEHEKPTSSSTGRQCATCHPTPRNSFGAWNQSCVTGGCHSPASSAPFHARATTSHAAPPSSQVCFDCHSGTDLPTVHTNATDSSGKTSCLVCHGTAGAPATNDCTVCHFTFANHYNVDKHRSSSTLGECAGSGCHSTRDLMAAHTEHNAAFTCAGCHSSSKPEVSAAIQAGATACGSCHTAFNQAGGHRASHWANPPLADVLGPNYSYYTGSAGTQPTRDCAGCHVSNIVDEHVGRIESGFSNPLPRRDSSGSALTCATCHKSLAPAVRNAILTGQTKCDACHVVHGPIRRVHTGTFSAASAVNCASCHTADISAEHNGTYTVVTPSGARLTGCDVCHSYYEAPRGTQVQAAITSRNISCTGCHSAQHPDLGSHSATTTASLQCGTCHAAGSSSIDVKAVHAGASAGACAVCHTPSSRVPAISAKTAECSSCHSAVGTDYHRGLPAKHTYSTMPATCMGSNCHSTKLLPETHQPYLSRYPAYTTTCALCHRNTNPSRIPANATAACDSCHGPIHPNMDHVARNSVECVSCHETSDALVVHARAQAGPCAVCHANPARVPTLPDTTDCVNCHKYSPIDPKHYRTTSHTAIETGCTNCHYLDMKTEHSRPTVGPVGCVQCHETKVDAFTTPWNKTCARCHPTKHGDMALKHRSTNTTCGGAGCHNITDASDIHKGAVGGGCGVCHKSVTQPAVTTNCSATGCHPSVTGSHRESHDGRGVNGVGCEGCHFRYLDDEHLSLGRTCATCHTATDSVARRAITAKDRRCLTCHPTSAHNRRQASEFATRNASVHRVRADLPGMRSSFVVAGTTYTWALPTASSFLRTGFALDTIVTCNACHTYTGTTGPHGATMKVNIDPAFPNPYKVVNGSETFTAQLSKNSSTGMSMSKGGSTTAKIICEKCHDLNGTGSTWSNKAHAEHDDRGREGSFCNQCHVAVPHGWGRPRLVGYVSDAAPYRTWVGTSANKDGGLARITVKSYTPSTWDKSNCGAGCDTGKHPLTGTSWPNLMGPVSGPTTGTVSGKVTDSSTGGNISGATVSVSTTVSATTATDGTYSLRNLAPGAYTATVTRTGYTTWTGPVSVTAGSVTTLNVALVPAVTAVNHARTGTATASSSSSSNGPALAIDGSATTFWQSGSAGTQWLRVDLGTSRSLSRVVVNWNGSNFAQEYRIETSADGSSWTSRFSTTSGVSGIRTHTFSAVNARFVRITCTKTSASSYRINEFEVWNF